MVRRLDQEFTCKIMMVSSRVMVGEVEGQLPEFRGYCDSKLYTMAVWPETH